MYRLPEALRPKLKDPLGPVRSGDEAVDAVAGQEPLLAVGDVVTRTFVEAGRVPDVMVVDGHTKRTESADDPLASLGEAPRRIAVENPAAEITDGLLEGLRGALEAEDPVVVDVDGEEDLAALPLTEMAPDGAAVVYGQPDEGVVTVTVTPDKRRQVRRLLDQMEEP
jgi:uncharacterized protein (UPF0218 family)